MKKFSGVGRGLFIQSNAADSEVGRVSPSTVENPLSSQSPPIPDLYEGSDTIGKSESASEPSVLPQGTGDGTKDEEGKDISQNSGCDPPDQDSSIPALDDNAKSKGPEASAKLEGVRISSLEDHPKVYIDTWKSEPSALSHQDKSPECVEPVTSAEVPLKDTIESVTDPTPSATEGNIHVESEFISKTEEVKESNEISESSNTRVVENENSSVEPKSGEGTKDNENESTNESDPSVNDKSKIHIAANLNSPAPTSKGSKTTPDIPLLPSPVKVPGAGILGAAPNAPLLPRGPPPMFPKALPISIPPPPMDLRLPPPKKVPKTKEELLQILTEQVGLIQPLDEKGAVDQGRGKTAPPDDQKSKAQPKKQQYPQRQQQHQQHPSHQPGQPWQNPGRENNWRPKTDGKGQQNNMRMPQQGMTNMQNRQPNTSGKKPSPQGTMKSGLSSLTKDELEKEYQWQKFSVERKIKKILKSLKTSTNEEVIKELLAVIKFNPSKLANFPWPKEQYVVLEKLIEHAIVNTDNDDALHKRIATIINSLQDMHPQGFKEDLKNAIMHEQGEYIQGSSSEFRRKQARSASHFLGELYNLSRVSSTEFKASVQSVIALALKDWIKAPNVTSTSEDSRLLLEVNSECLEEFLILTLRDNDENIKKQVLTLLKEEVLSTTRPKEARNLLLDTLFNLACQRCTAGIPTTAHVNQDKRDAKTDSGLFDTSPAKVTSSSPQLPISPQKPNNQQDGKWATQQQQQQQRQQQQNPPFPGPRYTSPPPSGLAQVPRRLPPGQHPMSFPQGHPVNTSVPPPSINQPGHNIPRFPPPQGPPPVPVPMSAAATCSGIVMTQLPQQTQHHQQQQHQQHGYANQSTPASIQASQGSHPPTQSQISQGGSQRHSHGLAATLAMVQQGAISDPQAVAAQQILGNAVHQAANIPPSQASSMPSMMYANSQVNPHSVSGVPGQQMMQDGNIQAGTAHGHTVQSSQFLRNIQVSLAQQMNTSLNFQQQEELVNQLGHIGLSGSSPWQRSGICVTQAVTTPLSSTAQGMNPSLNRQDMLTASPGIQGVPSSQGGMSSQPPFTQSAGSGTFVDYISAVTPNQDFKQNSNDARQGIGQWGMPAQDSPWSEKLLDSNQLPTSPPPSFTSPLQTPNQWSGDGQSVTSQEAGNDTPQEPSGWGDGSPGPQESSQQRLGTDGWGTSIPSQGIASWGANPLPGNPKTTDGWNGHIKSVPGHQSGPAQQIFAERPEAGSSGFPSQAPQNVSQTPSKNMYNFEESASSGGSEYLRSGAYTLPSRHKEGSPAAEGVSYSAMSELGSYGIDPGNSYESASYGGAYTPIRDGGGYGDHLPPGAQKVDGYVLLPESNSVQESTSPEPVDFKAIRNCVVEEDDDLSIYERTAHENQLRNREQYGQPDWAMFGAPKDKHVPSPYAGRNRRENIHRGQGRGSLRVTNPCTAMPPFPAAHPPGSNLPPFKQNFSPRN
nr:uncharacterized protein LOC129273638 [Lytechinus pictus]